MILLLVCSIYHNSEKKAFSTDFTSVDHLLDFLKSLSFSKQPVAPRTCEERVRTFARVEYEGQAGSDSVAPGA